MRVNILVGGPLEMVLTELILQRKDEKWIGVDRGELQGLEGKITRIKTYPPEKDYTDTQLGVKFAIQEQAMKLKFLVQREDD